MLAESCSLLNLRERIPAHVIQFQEPTRVAFSLSITEVRVWSANLSSFQARVGEFFATLSDDERRRAERFHFRVDHDRFVISRALLRKLLGGYLGCKGHSLLFSYGRFGKPALMPNHPAIHFNVAHAKGWAAFAFCRAAQVGVDVEDVNRVVDWDGIASRFFAQEEVAWIRAAGKGRELAAFFRCWTRKEAVLKALGEGLNFPLTGVDVVSQPGTAVWHAPFRAASDSLWKITDLDCSPECCGAVAVSNSELFVIGNQLPASFR